MKVQSDNIYVLVIYVGKESRFLMNSSKAMNKMGKTDKEINHIMFVIFIILLFVSIIIFLLSGNLLNKYGYVFFVRMVVIFGEIIPISLKVNVEMAKLYYAY